MAADVLALIPARMGSKGIPGKNFRVLAGLSPIDRAINCACQALARFDLHLAISTDATEEEWDGAWLVPYDLGTPGNRLNATATRLMRPPALAQDGTPMIDVVQHALEAITGPEDQIIVLLQPTQPLRKPEHVTRAIQLLEQTQADSVVSVVEIALRDEVLFENNGWLSPMAYWDGARVEWANLPTRRQGAPCAFKRDGTVYAFRRSTVTQHGNIYGSDVEPLIIPAEDTCNLDTEADWAEAERRLRALSEVRA